MVNGKQLLAFLLLARGLRYTQGLSRIETFAPRSELRWTDMMRHQYTNADLPPSPQVAHWLQQGPPIPAKTALSTNHTNLKQRLSCLLVQEC